MQITCSLISICLNSRKLTNLDYWSRDMPNFDILEKGFGRVSAHIQCMIFQEKMFLLLYSINWPNLTVWLSLLLEILGNMCKGIVCFLVCDVINFEINLLFLISHFSTWPKCQDKIKISWERKDVLSWNKKHFTWFVKTFLILESVSLRNNWISLECLIYRLSRNHIYYWA